VIILYAITAIFADSITPTAESNLGAANALAGGDVAKRAVIRLSGTDQIGRDALGSGNL
jgi:predicted dinucleotide-binding enzyme